MSPPMLTAVMPSNRMYFAPTRSASKPLAKSTTMRTTFWIEKSVDVKIGEPPRTFST